MLSDNRGRFVVVSFGRVAAVVASLCVGQACLGQTPAITVMGELDASAPSINDFFFDNIAISEYDTGVEIDFIPFAVTETSEVTLDLLSFLLPPSWFHGRVRVYPDTGGPLDSDNPLGDNDGFNDFPPMDFNGSLTVEDPFLQLTLDRGRYIAVVGHTDMRFVDVNTGVSGGNLQKFDGPFPVTSGAYRLDIYGTGVAQSLDDVIVTNTTQGTTFSSLRAAIDAANDHDEIVLSPGVLSEDGIDLPDGKDLVIRGSGVGQTIIDGGGDLNPQDAIFNAVNVDVSSRTVISDMTLRNGFLDQLSGGGAIVAEGGVFEAKIERVSFEGNRGNDPFGGGAHVRLRGPGINPRFERCRFVDGRDAYTAIVFENNSGAKLINSFVEASQTTRLSQIIGGSVEFVNCTLVDGDIGIQNTAELMLINSAFTGLILPGGGATFSGIQSVFQQATTGLAGLPAFVNPAQGDYRIVRGAPGSDGGSFGDYAAAGGGVYDLAGIGRFFDDPFAGNIASDEPALDIGAFEYAITTANFGCNDADIQVPFGLLTFNDISAFLAAFAQGCP